MMGEPASIFITSEDAVGHALNAVLGLVVRPEDATVRLLTPKDYYAAIEREPPRIVVVATTPNHYATRALITAAKHHAPRATVIATGLGSELEASIEAGADYFIPVVGAVRYNQTQQQTFGGVLLLWHVVLKALGERNLERSEEALIIEKKEFYDYVARNKLFDERAEFTADKPRELQFIEEHLGKHNCRTVFDAGCGNGRLALPLAKRGHQVVAGDLSAELIRQASERSQSGNPRFIQLNLLRTGLRGGFDAVLLMWHVLCELRDHQDELLREMHHLLRPGGIIIFDFPDKARNTHIDAHGRYEDAVNGFMKYVGLVPDISMLLNKLMMLGFSDIEYRRLEWGIGKFVVVAKKR